MGGDLHRCTAGSSYCRCSTQVAEVDAAVVLPPCDQADSPGLPCRTTKTVVGGKVGGTPRHGLLGMDGCEPAEPADGRKRGFESRSIERFTITRRSSKDLSECHCPCPPECREIGPGPDPAVDRITADRVPRCFRDTLPERLLGYERRNGVWLVYHHGNATGNRTHAPALPVLLSALHPPSHVDMHIDGAGKDSKASAQYQLVRGAG